MCRRPVGFEGLYADDGVGNVPPVYGGAEVDLRSMRMIGGQVKRPSNGRGTILSRSAYTTMYYVAFICLYVNFIVGSVSMLNNFEAFTPLLVLTASILLLTRIGLLNRGRPIGPVLVTISCIAIGGVSFLLSGESNILMLLMLVFGLGDIRGETILNLWLRMTLFVLLCMIAFVVLEPLTGLAPETVVRPETGAVRHGLYFTHPNTLGILLSTFAISLSIVYGAAKRSIDVICISIVAMAYIITDSKGALIMGGIYFVLKGMLARLRSRPSELILCAIPSICMAFTLLVVLGDLDSALFDVLQSILTGRPALWRFQYEHVGMTLFGQRVIFGAVDCDGWHYTGITIDSAYASYLVYIGIASYAVFQFLYWRAQRGLYGDGGYRASAALAGIALLGVVESSAINPILVVPLVCIGAYVDCHPKGRFSGCVEGMGPMLGKLCSTLRRIVLHADDTRRDALSENR